MNDPSPDPESTTDDVPVRTVSAYRLVELVGRGGMGAVYKAVHTALRRTVAVKLLPADRLADPAAVGRFRREVEAAGRLDHPHIVRTTDAGEADGQHFLVMEWLAGEDLARHVGRVGPLPVERACEFVRQAALGLDHAHRSGLVHRDVKPSNLLLTAGEGGRPVVKVLDLGLALLRDRGDADGDLTGAGQVMGTFDYMAPEQAAEAHAVDDRADVYGLGCTLYFLLAGRAPFRGLPAARKLVAHRTQEPPPLGRADVPPGVLAVLRRMMAKDPAGRPQSAAEVAEALEGVGRPGPAGGRPTRRRLAAGALALLAATVLVVGLARVFTPGPGDRPPAPPGPPPARPDPADPEALVFRHPAAVVRLAVAPDGRAAASACLDGSLHLWDLRTGGHTAGPAGPFDLSPAQPGRAAVEQLAFLSDRAVLVCVENRVGPNNGLVWDLGENTLARRPWRDDGDRDRGSPAWPDVPRSGRGPVLMARLVGPFQEAHLERPDGRFIARLGAGGQPLRLAMGAPSLSADGKRVLADSNRDNRWRLWDTDRPADPAPADPVPRSLAGDAVDWGRIAPDGRSAAFATRDRYAIVLWDFSGPAGRQGGGPLSGHTARVRALDFSADGRRLLSGGADGKAILWDLGAMTGVRTFEGHTGAVTAVALTPDGRYAVSAGADGTVRRWRLPAAPEPTTGD